MACENQDPTADFGAIAAEPRNRAWRRVAPNRSRRHLLLALPLLLAVLFWLATWERKPTWTFDFLPQGGFLATATGWIDREDAVRVWDLASGRVAWSITSAKPICSFAFSPDGKTLAIGNTDGAIEWRDLATRAKRFEVCPHRSPVGVLHYSDDGKTLVAMWVALGVIKTYEVTDGAVRELATVHAGTPGSVVISHDGEHAAVGVSSRPGVKDSVTLYGLKRGPRISGPHLSYTAHALAFSHDDRRLALAGEGEVRIWSLDSEEFVDAFKAPGVTFLGVAFSPDDRYLAAAGRGCIVLWEARSGKRMWEASATKDQAHDRQFFFSPVFSPDGRTLVAGDHFFEWSLWHHPTSQALAYDVRTGRQLVVLPPNRPFVTILVSWIAAFAVWAILWLRCDLKPRRMRRAFFDVLLFDGAVLAAVVVRLATTGVRGNAVRLPVATSLGMAGGLLGLLIVWAMLADSRWQWRAPGLIAGCGAMWAVLIALCRALAFGEEGVWRITVGATAMLATLLVLLHFVQKRGLRLSHLSEGFIAAETGPVRFGQFGMLQLLAWTAAAALLFGAARLVVPQDRPAALWFEAALGVGQAIICAAAVWAVLGRSPAVVRLPVLLIVPSICGILAHWAPQPSGSLPRDWDIAFHLSASLLVAFSLGVFRWHGLRLRPLVQQEAI